MVKKLFKLGILIFLIIFNCQNNKLTVREPAVSGQFYPSDKKQIENMIKNFLDNAENVIKSSKGYKPGIVGLVSPHAGYVYSGSVAAWGFKQIENEEYDTIVILGQSHHTSLRNPSIFNGDGYKTPLGIAKFDNEFIKKLKKNYPDIEHHASAHKHEHSIEVQIPFLQYIYKDRLPPIVPILVNSYTPGKWLKFGRILGEEIKDKNILIKASTDMSHFPPYSIANTEDKKTLDLIKKYDINGIINREIEVERKSKNNLRTTLCGLGAVAVMMEAIKVSGYSSVEIVRYRNSGDVPEGDKNRVVGYGSVAFLR